jgi:hypothetical protein
MKGKERKGKERKLRCPLQKVWYFDRIYMIYRSAEQNSYSPVCKNLT